MRPFQKAALIFCGLGIATSTTSPASPTPEASPTTGAVVATPQANPKGGHRQLALARKRLDDAELAENEKSQRESYLAAGRHAELAIEILPENADAYFLRFAARGRLAQMDGLALGALQLPALQRELDLILQLNPEHADALSSRGGMLVKLPYLLGGNVSEGIRMLQLALKLDPQSVGKRLELAEAYHIDGRNEAAQTIVAEARAIATASGSTRKLETVKKFSVALQESCPGCAVESIGR